MRFSTLRIILLSLLIWAIICDESYAAAPFHASDLKDYQVTFGESYPDFLPGSLIRMEVTFKNNGTGVLGLSQELVVLDSMEAKIWKTLINLDLNPNGSQVIQLMVPVPKSPGVYTLTLGRSADLSASEIPSRNFNVIQPNKSPRLAKILVHTPDFEEGLISFLKTWNIKAPAFSWAQVLLFGEEGWARFSSGDPAVSQLISRALRREMSVIFLDFGPNDIQTAESKMVLPFGVTMKFTPLDLSAQNFRLKTGLPELNYGLPSGLIRKWNGYNGITVPAMEMKFEGKGVKISALATSGDNPVHFPLVEMIPQNGKGKLYLCQLITGGRLDESVQPPHYKADIAAYDPMAVQFLLNLISASVGDNLLK